MSWFDGGPPHYDHNNRPRKIYMDPYSPPPEKKTPLQTLAEAVADVDLDHEEIEFLRNSIRHLAQKVHQAYHGAHGPDADTGTWEQCNRGICKDAQYVLDPRRPRGGYERAF